MPITTTSVPATAGPCVQGWTDWINSIDGSKGMDYETIQTARDSGVSFCATDKIIDIECQSKANGNLTSSYGTCDLRNGMMCKSTAGFTCPGRYHFLCRNVSLGLVEKKVF